MLKTDSPILLQNIIMIVRQLSLLFKKSTTFWDNPRMMGWSPQCYIPSFVKIGKPVLEKKIFEGFFTIYGHGGHLGHVTSIMSINFHLPCT